MTMWTKVCVVAFLLTKPLLAERATGGLEKAYRVRRNLNAVAATTPPPPPNDHHGAGGQPSGNTNSSGNGASNGSGNGDNGSGSGNSDNGNGDGNSDGGVTTATTTTTTVVTTTATTSGIVTNDNDQGQDFNGGGGNQNNADSGSNDIGESRSSNASIAAFSQSSASLINFGLFFAVGVAAFAGAGMTAARAFSSSPNVVTATATPASAPNHPLKAAVKKRLAFFTRVAETMDSPVPTSTIPKETDTYELFDEEH